MLRYVNNANPLSDVASDLVRLAVLDPGVKMAYFDDKWDDEWRKTAHKTLERVVSTDSIPYTDLS